MYMSFLAFERKRIWQFVIKDVEGKEWGDARNTASHAVLKGRGKKKPRGKITIIYTIKRNKTRRKKKKF